MWAKTQKKLYFGWGTLGKPTSDVTSTSDPEEVEEAEPSPSSAQTQVWIIIIYVYISLSRYISLSLYPNLDNTRSRADSDSTCLLSWIFSSCLCVKSSGVASWSGSATGQRARAVGKIADVGMPQNEVPFSPYQGTLWEPRKGTQFWDTPMSRYERSKQLEQYFDSGSFHFAKPLPVMIWDGATCLMYWNSY